MKTHYDRKGKLFTDVVSKTEVPVIIQTDNHCIRGNYHARPEKRLKDELNRCEDTFIAITQATVFDRERKVELYNTAFLALNREEIIWLIPEEELVKEDGRDGGGR